MERSEFVAVLEPLRVALRAEMDRAGWEVYFRALADIPRPLLEEAVSRLLREDRQFFPKVTELRAAAERVRLSLRTAMTFEPCDRCELSPGWAAILVDGVPRVTRCDCWKAHQQRIAALGAGSEPLALPASRESELARIGDTE